ncbi:MAG: hypothetical protein R3F48_05635 [Candidatus Zixiibacteriota bacterium]
MQETRCNKSTVILLGTIHFGSDHYPKYIRQLHNIILEISPDVICAEISPDQLDGSTTCNSKPEYPCCILPISREKSIPVVPIQPGCDEPIATSLEDRKLTALQSASSNSAEAKLLEYIKRCDEVSINFWRTIMRNEMAIERVQSSEFHIAIAPQAYVMAEYFPEFMRLSDEWNEYFLGKIENTITSNKYQKILVIVGLGHKYWLWDHLKKRTDIILHNILTFREKQDENRKSENDRS